MQIRGYLLICLFQSLRLLVVMYSIDCGTCLLSGADSRQCCRCTRSGICPPVSLFLYLQTPLMWKRLSSITVH